MLYIKEDTRETPVEPVVLKPVTNQAGKKVDNTETSEASSETAKSEHALVYNDSETTTDVKPSIESPKLDETLKPAPSIDELVNSAAAPVAIALSEISHDKKDDNSASNTDQGSAVSDSINTLISEAPSTAVSVVSSEVSESTTVSSEESETEISSGASTSESAIPTTTAISEISTSVLDSTSTIVSESEVVEEPVVSLTDSESQASTSEVVSAISETVSTSEEIIFDGMSENINSWNRLSETSRVSEFLPSTSETITEAASLFSNYARYSETASSESHSMVAPSSEVSIEKLAVSILKDTEGGLYDAATIRNIVEMIDSITTNVSYTRSSHQDLVNTASSDNTYNGSQDLNLASKTTTQAGDKGSTEDLKATIAKTAKSHKWGEHAVAILTAIVLAGATALAALRNFLMSKKANK